MAPRSHEARLSRVGRCGTLRAPCGGGSSVQRRRGGPHPLPLPLAGEGEWKSRGARWCTDSRWAVSSAVEHYLDMVGVTSSILVPPTIIFAIVPDGGVLGSSFRFVTAGSLPDPERP